MAVCFHRLVVFVVGWTFRMPLRQKARMSRVMVHRSIAVWFGSAEAYLLSSERSFLVISLEHRYALSAVVIWFSKIAVKL